MDGVLNLAMTAIGAGIACSPDGMMAVLINFRHIQDIRDAFTWSLWITAFHTLLGGSAAAITAFATDWQNGAFLAVRLFGIVVTGYFARDSLKEALNPEDQDKTLTFKEVLITTAVVGSLDAASFGHGSAVHLVNCSFLSVMSNWTVSSVVVGILTLITGITAWKGRSVVKKAGTPFLIVGAIMRVGLFIGLGGGLI